MQQLIQTAQELFVQLRQTALEACATPVQMRCISAIAEGSDSILTGIALENGYDLLCPLPFHKEIYEQDFALGEPRDRFNHLLSQAKAIYEIDGNAGKAEAYENAGRLLLEQSDILLAIWDGNPERGVGGTGQIVREALLIDMPVLIIDAAAPHSARIIGEKDIEINDIIKGWIRRLLVAPPPSGKIDQAAVYRREALSEAVWAKRLNAAMEHLLLIGCRNAPATALPPLNPAEIPKAVTQSLATIDSMIAPHLATADQLAVRYAALYRSAATLRYLAVLPATGAALLASYAPPALSRIGLAIQLFILLGTFLVSWVDKRVGWHSRFLDYRYIAEHLRQSRTLALFGSTAAVPRATEGDTSATSGWADWHIRAVVRAVGLISAKIDADFMQGSGKIVCFEADEQQFFYEQRGQKFSLLAARLRKVGTALFLAGVVFVVIRMGLTIFGLDGRLFNAVAVLALIVPALSPVFFGLQSQNEYGRLSQRYDSMAKKLKRIGSLFPLHMGTYARLEPLVRQTSTLLLAEVSDWSTMIKAHGIGPN